MQRHRKAPSRQGIEFFPVGEQSFSGQRHDLVAGQRQRTGSRHRRVELAQGSRGGISRVRKGFLAALGHRAVQGLEIIEPHIHFTPHDQSGRVARIGHQLEGQRPYRSQVDRDVLSGGPVSSGGASSKHATFVQQFHRKPIEFWLRRVLNGRRPPVRASSVDRMPAHRRGRQANPD